MADGFIKLSRALLDWDWHDEPKTAWLYAVMLMLANHEETLWRGEKLLRGQLLTGRRQLSIASGLTDREVRTALEHLKRTGDVQIEPKSKYSVVTLPRYDAHCTIDQRNDQQTTGTASGKRPAERPAESPQSDQQATSSRPANDHIQELKELRELKEVVVNAPARGDDDLVFSAVQLSHDMDALEAQWRKMGNLAAQTDLEQMERLIADYPVEEIVEAMQAAAENGVKHSWPYIRKVLANWKAHGKGVRTESRAQEVDPYAGLPVFGGG